MPKACSRPFWRGSSSRRTSIVALRFVGTARAGAYFSIAPFFGAVLALVLGAPLTVPLIVAAVLMAIGVALHLTERHEHTHETLTRTHAHYPDSDHRHARDG
jgi:hypothetical protein